MLTARHVGVALVIVNNNPETRELRRRRFRTAAGWYFRVSRAQRSTQWCAADPGPPQSVTVPDQRCTAPLRYALHRIRDTQASDARVPYSLFKQPISFPRRICARVCDFSFTHPESRGWAERRETFGCSAEHPWGVHITRHARRLRGALRPITRDARLSALHRGGLGSRGRASLTGICAGSVTASSSHPGRSAWRAGSLPPETSGYGATHHRTPRLAPHSGSSLEHALNERGCESYTLSSISSQEINSICIRTARAFISRNGRADRQIIAGRPSAAIRPLKGCNRHRSKDRWR